MLKEGYPCQADASIDKVKPEDFDGVIIPGGFAPDFMRRDDRFAEFIKRQLQRLLKLLMRIKIG